MIKHLIIYLLLALVLGPINHAFLNMTLFLYFSLGGSTGENDLWQGLKAPTTYHDQRSKFRQQASPYVRPT